MRWWIAAVLAMGCGKHDASPAPPPPPSAPVPVPVPSPSVTQQEAHALALAACPKVAHAVYYTVEKHGKTSHVLGTRHFGVGLDRMPAAIAPEIEHAKVAVFETAPGDDANVEIEHVTLPDVLGKPAWDHLRELVGEERLAAIASAGAAMYAAIIVPSSYEDLTDQLDDELGAVATKARVPTRGLESSMFQSQTLHDIFSADVARAIIMSIKDRDEIKSDTARELTEYCSGNPGNGGFDDPTRRYFKAAGYDDTKVAALEAQLVFSRTASWIPKLGPLLDAGGAFVAVGADHLVGDKGLVALLRQAGYTVTPVP